MIFNATILSALMSLIGVGPDVKKWIDMGLPIVAELQKEKPNVIPILAEIGEGLFPKMKDQIKIVTAAAEALFDPHGTQWVQQAMNTLANAGLDVDGSYGPKTRAAVESFQRAHQPDSGPIDGWAGPKTNAVIVAELAKLQK